MIDRRPPDEEPETVADRASYWKRYRSRWAAHAARRTSVDLEAIGSTLNDDDELPTIT